MSLTSTKIIKRHPQNFSEYFCVVCFAGLIIAYTFCVLFLLIINNHFSVAYNNCDGNISIVYV
jgi:hypothetical protein